MALVSPTLKLGTQGVPPSRCHSAKSLSQLRSDQALRISYLWGCQEAGLPRRVLTACREAGTLPPAFPLPRAQS